MLLERRIIFKSVLIVVVVVGSSLSFFVGCWLVVCLPPLLFYLIF